MELMEGSEIRNNPPSLLITTFEQRDLYKTLYDDFTKNGAILQFKDRNTLALLVLSMLDVQKYRAHIDEHGVMMVVNGDKGNPITRINKVAELLDKKENKIITLLKAFGAAPEYRTSSENKSTVDVQSDNDGFGTI